MSNRVSIYKGYVIVPRGANFQVYDYAGRLKITFPSERQARDYIDADIQAQMKARGIRKNPQTIAHYLVEFGKNFSGRVPFTTKVEAEAYVQRKRLRKFRIVPVFLNQNPPRETEIYAQIKEIVAVKGRNHKCDAACKRARHTYRHVFTSPARIVGLPNGNILIKSVDRS